MVDFTLFALTAVVAALGNYVTSAMDLSCNLANDDNCSFRNDGACDSNLGTPFVGCEDSDCFDCRSFCAAFNYNPNGCLANNCFYCPGDALCLNAPYTDYPQRLVDAHEQTNIFQLKTAACNAPEDYKTNQTGLGLEDNRFDDPLKPAEVWAFNMIRLFPVWDQGITGQGIRVRVNDDGFDPTHPEFAGRFDEAGSCADYSVKEIEASNPNYSHGTVAGSIVGAAADNGVCAVGVAPGVTFSACELLSLDTAGGAAALATNVAAMDISSNSWVNTFCNAPSRRNRGRRLNTCPFATQSNFFDPCGTCDFSSDTLTDECRTQIQSYCTEADLFEQNAAACLTYVSLWLKGGQCFYNDVDPAIEQAFATLVGTGRGGKGVVIVFASGNDLLRGASLGGDEQHNSRFIIVVGAVGKDGLHASYSTPGSNVLVSAPGGDDETFTQHVGAGLNGACIDSGSGTSFAAPVVSGVVALLLETRPALSWRDVKGIFVSTSRSVLDPLAPNTFTTNAAGFHHSNEYGFGIVDAEAAVNAAKSWTLYGPEKDLLGSSGTINLSIPDTNTPVSSTITLSNSMIETFTVEAVTVYLAVQHRSRGNLKITLTSPSGTVSTLHPGGRPEYLLLPVDELWTISTVALWGEVGLGEWRLTLTDTIEGSSECSNLFVSGFTCSQVTENCANGMVVKNDTALYEPDEDGLTAVQACCSCGGGSRSAVEPLLVSWRIAAYGQETALTPTVGGQSTPTPTPMPTPAEGPTSTTTAEPTSAAGAHSTWTSIVSALLIALSMFST